MTTISWPTEVTSHASHTLRHDQLVPNDGITYSWT